ncbi:unnamed protein product [Durusdinium trenchii]|uniref:tRNA(Phe) (4-demethylwyosine(37)-C(7)) aminocarboxypropyltransferase n=1 Tax=Durusdinium trenchii TaxID=1381693 RepID=A0ABP0MTW8_9DINO
MTESTLAEGRAAAMALTNVAGQCSPFLQLAIEAGKFPLSSVYQYGSDDVLHAAPAPSKPTRAALAAERPKPLPREVPPSVVSCAAAIRQAVNVPGIGLPDMRVAQVPARPGALPERRAALPKTRAGGGSRWLRAPEGVTAASRLAVQLPEDEFTYIDRPWPHFVTRWAAIDATLQDAFGEAGFTLLDLGSCSGFFSLQAAVAYPNAQIVGVEGSATRKQTQAVAMTAMTTDSWPLPKPSAFYCILGWFR